MITVNPNGSMDAKIHVDSSWAGNSITGQLIKELILETGSITESLGHIKNITVLVMFDPRLLPRMTVEMVAAVLADYQELRKKVKSIRLEWAA